MTKVMLQMGIMSKGHHLKTFNPARCHGKDFPSQMFANKRRSFRPVRRLSAQEALLKSIEEEFNMDYDWFEMKSSLYNTLDRNYMSSDECGSGEIELPTSIDRNDLTGKSTPSSEHGKFGPILNYSMRTRRTSEEAESATKKSGDTAISKVSANSNFKLFRGLASSKTDSSSSDVSFKARPGFRSQLSFRKVSSVSSVEKTDSETKSQSVKEHLTRTDSATASTKSWLGSNSTPSVQRTPEDLETIEPCEQPKSSDETAVVGLAILQGSLESLLRKEYASTFEAYSEMTRCHMELVYAQVELCVKSGQDVAPLLHYIEPLISSISAVVNSSNHIQRFDSVCALIRRLVTMDSVSEDEGIRVCLAMERVILPPILDVLQSSIHAAANFTPIAMAAITNLMAETKRPHTLLQLLVNQRVSVMARDIQAWQDPQILGFRFMRAELISTLAHVTVKMQDEHGFRDCLSEVKASLEHDTSESVRKHYQYVFRSFGNRHVVTSRELSMGIDESGDCTQNQWIQARSRIDAILDEFV